MKNFKQYISENFDEYLNMPHEKKFRALVIMTDESGKEHNFPIGSNNNVRSAAHEVVKELSEKGFQLKDVEYEF